MSPGINWGPGDLLQNRAQFVSHCRDLLITVFRVFCEGLVDYLLQLRRKRILSHFGERLRRSVKYLMTHVDHRLSLKRPDSGQHFVKQYAGRKNVRSMVGTFALGLFGCSVRRGSVGYSKFGYLCSVEAAVLFFLFVLQQFCEAEIEDLHLPRSVTITLPALMSR